MYKKEKLFMIIKQSHFIFSAFNHLTYKNYVGLLSHEKTVKFHIHLLFTEPQNYIIMLL